jgi:uncharacterized membrane protein YbaN (DUF454 family)
VFVFLGTLGIFLPLLPSTVFFILAAWCFARSSEKFYNRLITHPRIGRFIRNYLEKRGMPLRAKVAAVSMLTITTGCSALFFTEQLLIRLFLLVITISVSAYIISLKTLNETLPAESE